MGRWLRELTRFFTEAIWTLWLGGLTFYIAIVIPAGTTVVGSTTQGEITSIVTGYLNGLAILAAIAMLPWKSPTDRRPVKKWKRWQWTSCAAIALIACVQIWLRMLLWERMESGGSTGAESALGTWSFYSLHRLYLWLTTLQWICGVVMLWNQHRFVDRITES